MKQMFDPFSYIKISKNSLLNTDYTEYVLKEKNGGAPKQFCIKIANNLTTDKIVIINAEKFLASATLVKPKPVQPQHSGLNLEDLYNSRPVDFAVIDFRNLNLESENNEIIIYLIELGNHSPHELKLKYNSTFSILTAFISKYLQLHKLNPDDHFKFKCAYGLIHVIESELKLGMISDESKNIKSSKHTKYDYYIIKVNSIDYSCQFEDIESFPKKYMVLESLIVK